VPQPEWPAASAPSKTTSVFPVDLKTSLEFSLLGLLRYLLPQRFVFPRIQSGITARCGGLTLY
jgi:hypothetical protein